MVPKKILVQNNCWVQKNIGSKKILDHNFGWKIYVNIFWTKQILGTRKLEVKQKYWVQKILGPKFFFVQKNLRLLKNILGLRTILVLKFFGVQKIWVKQIFGFKKLFRLYEACVLNLGLWLYPEPFRKFAVVVVGVESDFSFLLLAKP